MAAVTPTLLDLGTVAMKDVDPAEYQRLKAGILGDFEKVVLFVADPQDGKPAWRVESTSDIENFPPGIVAGRPMPDATRNHLFHLMMGGCLRPTPAYFFARIERG